MGIKKIFKKIENKLSRIFQEDKGLTLSEQKRLAKLERYHSTIVLFYGKNLKVVDPLTFLNSYVEIFKNGIYRFNSSRKDITIIDCGANIGLATIYFKMNFPYARIIAFEPDPNIFAALQENVSSFGYQNIICKNEAVSTQDGILNFNLEGGHSGMITSDEENSIKVKATRLKSFLKSFDHITFLKIDIEGEEINVIPDIAEELKKVDYLFLEYHSFMNLDQSLDNLLFVVKEAGMRYYIKEAANKPFPFMNEEIFLNMDVLVNIFCYRQLNMSNR